MAGFKILPPLVSFLIVSKKASYPKWFKENYVKKSVGAIATITGLIAIGGDTILKYPTSTIDLK
jgi:hypothetical protein